MIKNLNNEGRMDVADAIESAKNDIEEALEKVRYYVRNNWRDRYDNADAYIFRHIEEHCDNANPYNQSLQTLIDELLGHAGDDRMEPIEELGESWEDE